MSASGTSEAGPVEAIPETIPEPIPQEAEDVIDKSTPEGNPTSPTPEPEPAAKKPTDTEDPQVTIPKSHKKAANRERGEAKRKRPNVTPTSPSAEENDNANDESKDFQLRLPPGSVNDEVGDADFPEPDFVSRPSIPSEAILTSDELNFLVYRYLLESGFVHSAFVFGGESYISKTNIEDAAQLVPGALISFVQKGLQYLEIESHINDDGTETVCDEAFSVMKPHVCSSNTTKKRIFEPYEPMSADYGYLEIDDEEVLFLKGHEDLVTFCVWSPSGRLLASGSADGITRVWDVQSQTIPGRCTTSTLLKVGKKSEGGGEEKAQNEGGEGKGETSSSSSSSSRKRPRQAARKTETSCKSSVLALAWKDDSILASGSYDGATHIWNANGQLLHSATNHEGPVCCLQWAKRGAKTFASGGMDNAVVVCDQEGTVVAKFIHKGPVLDLDWRNDTIFATGSTDRRVRVFEVGKPEPIREFTTHRSDVNAVRWDPEGNLLASAGADCAVKVWNVLTGQCAHDFREHTREVVCLAWSSPPSSSSSTLMLASGSMDTTVKIWDVVQGKCMLTITKHTHPVTAIAFSPQGDAIATAAYERLCLWNAKDGELLRTFKHDGGINHLSWGNDYKLAVGCADHAVCVVDMTPKGNS